MDMASQPRHPLRERGRGPAALSLLLCAGALLVFSAPTRADLPPANPPAADAVAPLPVDPAVAPWSALPDRTAVARARPVWDNFKTRDALNDHYEMPVRPHLGFGVAQWDQYEADPLLALLRDGTPHFWIVTQLYLTGVLSRDRRAATIAGLQERLAKLPEHPQYRANLLLALLHIGFEEEALQMAREHGSEPWFRQSWDANFYMGATFVRHQEYETAVPYLERALELYPDLWTRLWLRVALSDRSDAAAAKRRDELFRFGPHMGAARVGDLPFRDRAEPLGFGRWHLAGAAAFFDMDNDTYLDMVANGVFASPELYRFRPGTGFVLTPDGALDAIQDVPSGAVAADFDNDGFTDLYFPQAAWFSAGPNRLLQNDGGKRFVDRSTLGQAALPQQNSCGPAALDYDRDGLVDLAVSGTAGGTLMLLHNKGGFVFEDVSAQAGLLPLKAVAVNATVGDVNDDGWPDIFVNTVSPTAEQLARDGETRVVRPPDSYDNPVNLNLLYINKGDGTFSEEAIERGVALGTPQGFGAWMFDYDDDGDLDILAATFATPQDTVLRGFQEPIPWGNTYVGPALYKNDGKGYFANISQTAGFVPASFMGAQMIDMDLDGRMDVVLGPGSHPLPHMQPLMFYRNVGDDHFELATPYDDPRFFGKFHGMAFADYDRDGDPDLFVNNGGVALPDRWHDLFLENTTTGKHWIHVGVEGRKSNRSAIGARVRVTAGGVTHTQEKAAGQGFQSTNSPYLIFGLAEATRADRVEIRWPSGLVQSLGPLAADQAVIVTEGSDTPRRIY